MAGPAARRPVTDRDRALVVATKRLAHGAHRRELASIIRGLTIEGSPQLLGATAADPLEAETDVA